MTDENRYALRKYPRTPHLEGSRLQPGDEDLSQVPFSAIAGRHLVVEEKIDGANSAVSFDGSARLLLQSRGHYLCGGYRERHYQLFKQWAAIHRDLLYASLGSRYIMYGEWMYAAHRVYYDALPHYFLEFDIYDRDRDCFLDTPSRRRLTGAMGVCSVPVLAEGRFADREDLLRLLGPSRFKTPRARERLLETLEREHLDAGRTAAGTDVTELMEGLYIKAESGGQVTDRLKYVRASFSQAAAADSTPWLDRPIVPNGLDRPLSALLAPPDRGAEGTGHD